MIHKIKLDFIIPENLAGERLDRALALQLPQYSRNRLKQWLSDGQLTVSGKILPAKSKVKGGEQIRINAELNDDSNWQAEDIALNIVFEDEALLVINKPINLVVHPAAGHRQGTLANALLYHYPELATLPRSGLIHRIDKDTSGLLVIAKTLEAQIDLNRQLQNKQIKREYEAIIQGHPTGGGTINAPIDRHPRQRTKMAVLSHGKPAITHYRILERLPYHTHIKVILETGRTHQIRVHLAHIGYPIIGDQTYGGRLKLPKGSSESLNNTLRQFKRQALHASQLKFKHPLSGEVIDITVPLAPDIQALLDCLHKG